MAFVDVPLSFEGRPLHLTTTGPASGPVVLFAHPFPLHAAAWHPLMDRCANAGLRAAAVDQPGFGKSPPLGRPLTMDLQARVLAAALDALGVTRASLVGCSMGGYALMSFARAYPGRMSKAVLMCTKAAADTDEARARREAQAQTALTQGPLAVTSQLLPNLVAPGVPQHEPALFARITALAAGATAQGIADALRGMAARPDSRPGMALWPSPALVIAGELDQAMPVSELRAMAEAIPGGKLRVIGGAGHYAMLERENEVAAEVVGFLE